MSTTTEVMILFLLFCCLCILSAIHRELRLFAAVWKASRDYDREKGYSVRPQQPIERPKETVSRLQKIAPKGKVH